MDAKTIHQFWCHASSLPSRGTTGGFVHRQYIAATRELMRQTDRFKRSIVGTVHRREFEDFLYPSYAEQERLNRNGRRTTRRGSGPGTSGLFHGRDWEELVVVPYFRAPGELCGFVCGDDREVRPSQFLMRTFSPRRKGLREAGLGMLDAALSSRTKEFAGTLFIMLDLDLALHLQLRWCRNNAEPLPLVVAFDDNRHRTEIAWQQLPASKRVLISSATDAATFRQAYLANADLAIVPDLREQLTDAPIERLPQNLEEGLEWCRIYSLDRILVCPKRRLKRFEQQSMPWQRLLATTLAKMPVQDAQQLLTEIALPKPVQMTVLNRVEPAARKRLHRIDDGYLTAPRFSCNKGVVVDFRGQWFIDETRKPVGPGVRINHLLTRKTGELVVKGSVRSDLGQIDFSIPGDRVEAVGLLSAVRRELATRGVPVQWCRGWSRHGFEVAKAFSQPQLVQEADVVGWCGWGFRLPRFGITIDGFEASAAAPLANDHDPGGRLAIPSSLTLRQCRTISLNTQEAAEFWAVVRCVILKIMAPVAEAVPTATILIGDQADQVVLSVANGLDASLKTIPSRRDAIRRFAEIRSQVLYHRWPTAIVGDWAAARRAGERAIPNCLASTSENCALELQRAGWHTLRITRAEKTATLITEFAFAVVLSYLASFAARRFEVQFSGPDWAEAVWQDLCQWFGPIGRGRAVRNASNQLIHPPEKRCVS